MNETTYNILTASYFPFKNYYTDFGPSLETLYNAQRERQTKRIRHRGLIEKMLRFISVVTNFFWDFWANPKRV